MPTSKYLYSFGYDNNQEALCELESKYLFTKEVKNRSLFSDLNIEPSISPFIKRRVEIVSFSEDYPTLLAAIKKEQIVIEGFKVEYIVLAGDTTEYEVRLEKLRDIGYSIEGIPDYYNPTIMYALCFHENIWYFGISTKNNLDWKKHNQKPCSYSNSISIHIAKALVNIAAKSDKAKILLDACCGAGTIMLEACFSGYKIEGCDINWKLCRDARINLAHFGYETTVFRSDVGDLTASYDAAIIDLPYNLSSIVSEKDILHIIKSTSVLAPRLVIVSIADISNLLSKAELSIIDTCSVRKQGKKNFARKIWVCENK